MVLGNFIFNLTPDNTSIFFEQKPKFNNLISALSCRPCTRKEYFRTAITFILQSFKSDSKPFSSDKARNTLHLNAQTCLAVTCQIENTSVPVGT